MFETIENNKRYWYNYRSNQYELIDTPTDFHDYIPQNDSAQAMYELLMLPDYKNMAPIDAAIEVMKACIGTND